MHQRYGDKFNIGKNSCIYNYVQSHQQTQLFINKILVLLETELNSIAKAVFNTRYVAQASRKLMVIRQPQPRQYSDSPQTDCIITKC